MSTTIPFEKEYASDLIALLDNLRCKAVGHGVADSTGRTPITAPRPLTRSTSTGEALQ